MSNKDLHNNIKAVVAISPLAFNDNTAQVSAIIDMKGYTTCEFITAIGTIGDAGATFTASLEHGDDAALADTAAVPDVDMLPISGAEAAASFTQADDDSVKRLGYVGLKRYVRYTVTPAGNATDATFSVVAVMGKPHVAAVANN